MIIKHDQAVVRITLCFINPHPRLHVLKVLAMFDLVKNDEGPLCRTVTKGLGIWSQNGKGTNTPFLPYLMAAGQPPIMSVCTLQNAAITQAHKPG